MKPTKDERIMQFLTANPGEWFTPIRIGQLVGGIEDRKKAGAWAGSNLDWLHMHGEIDARYLPTSCYQREYSARTKP